MHIAWPVFALFAASLSACAAPPPGVRTGGPLPPQLDRCNADRVQAFRGQIASAGVVEQARTTSGAEVARVLRPGQVVTLEFREGRLNVEVDDHNVIAALRCG